MKSQEIEPEDEEEEKGVGLEDLGKLEKHGIFARCHNSIVWHLGAERTLKALSLGDYGWSGMD